MIGSNGLVPDHGPAGARHHHHEQHGVTEAHIQDQPHYAVDAANQHGGESDSYDLFCAFGLLVDAGDGRGRVCRQLNGSLTCPVGCHPAAVQDDGASMDNHVGSCVENNAEHARSTPCDPVANWFWYRGSAPWCRFSPINGNAVYTLRDPCASLFWERNAVKDWQANAYVLLYVCHPHHHTLHDMIVDRFRQSNVIFDAMHKNMDQGLCKRMPSLHLVSQGDHLNMALSSIGCPAHHSDHAQTGMPAQNQS